MARPKGSLNRVRTLGQSVASEHCPQAFKVALDIALGKCFHHPDGLDFQKVKRAFAKMEFSSVDHAGNLSQVVGWLDANACECNPPTARLQAAKLIMEYGYGLPAHSTQIPLAEGEVETKVQAVIDLVAPPQYKMPVRGMLTQGGEAPR